MGYLLVPNMHTVHLYLVRMAVCVVVGGLQKPCPFAVVVHFQLYLWVAIVILWCWWHEHVRTKWSIGIRWG